MPGDQLYVAVTKKGFTEYVRVKFLKIEKGVIVAESVEWYRPNGAGLFSELAVGNIVHAVAKKCFLWGCVPPQQFERIIWFKNLDEPV